MSASGTPAPRRSRRDERKEETRAELVAAAAKVFARRGFQGASLVEIAREGGYSTGAVYWHFEGKDDLFLAVYEAQAAERVRDVEAFQRRHTDAELPQRARAYADQFMARLRLDPEFLILSLEFLVHAWRNPPLREAFSHRVAWGRLAATRLLEDGAHAEGYELPLPAEDLASVLRELGTGLGVATLADPDAIPEGLYGDFIELFFDLLEQRGRRERAPQATSETASESAREQAGDVRP